MAVRFGGARRKLKDTAARKRRLTILPKTDKLWLLAGTAIITGAVMFPTHPALADCTQGTNFLSCQDVAPNYEENDPQLFEAIDNGFEVDVGDNNTQGTISVGTYGSPALEVTSQSISGAPFGGNITITQGSTVEHTSGGTALYVNFVTDVTLTNNGTIRSQDWYSGYSGGSAVVADDFDSLTIVNNGTIAGSGGSGIQASNGGSLTVINTSPQTLLGEFAGVEAYDLDVVKVINSGGSTIGYDGFYSGQGVDFRDISGFETADESIVDPDVLLSDPDQDNNVAVMIFNSSRVDEELGLLGGGMILGGEDGIYGEDVWTGDVLVFNSGYWDKATEEELLENPDQLLVFRDGGLIAGEDDDGIDINGVGERVFIYNNNTLSSVALRDEMLGGATNAFLSDFDGDAPAGMRAGIWGDDNGISIDGEDGDDNVDETRFVGVYNINGMVGGRYGNGITAYDLEGEDPVGGLSGDDTSFAFGLWNGAGGMVWGGDDGVDLSDIDGSILIDNGGSWTTTINGANAEQLFGDALEEGEDFAFAGGNIYGEDNGILIDDVDRGNVGILNSQGSIVGYYEDGINVTNVYGEFTDQGMIGGNVTIINGFYTDGGKILGDDSAIQIGEDGYYGEDGAETAFIVNGSGGVIAGYGHSNDEAVVYLRLSNSYGLQYDGSTDTQYGGDADTDGDDVAAGTVVNLGLMSDYYLPTMYFGDTPEPGEQYDWGNEDDILFADLDSFNEYVMAGGSKSLLNGYEHDLSEYSYSASGLLLRGEDGAVEYYNGGVMVGNVWLDGYNQTDEGSGSYIGNRVDNHGVWLVSGEDGYSTDIDGYSNDDTIRNAGWIQAAFEDTREVWDGFDYVTVQGKERTEFYADYFDNFDYGEDYPSTGLISMVDGAGGDEVYINADFYAPDAEDYANGSRSYVAMDVFLQDDYEYELANNGEWASDFLHVGEDINGTTGLIVRRVNENTVNDGGIIGSSIHVASVDGEDEGACVDDFCKVGDTFYIAPQSDGYFESKQGTGFIEDGLFAWGLVGEAYDGIYGYEDSDYYLVGLPGPGAINAPKVATGALEIADEIFDVVSDHNYGEQFRTGGGGADLPVEAPVYDAPAASSGTQTGLWAKATGSNTDRDDSVSFGGNDFDSGYDQQIYTILGGADMKWSPDSPWRMGVFGGYVTSSMDFDLGNGDVDYEGGTVGTYLAYNNGAFYVDGTVKAEFLSADYSFDNSDVDTDVTNVGVSANTGYRFTMGNSYVEPLASIRYVHSNVDDFSGGGGSVEYSNADSLKAGAGARIGTAFQTGAATTELSLLGRVWNEFDGDSKVTVSDGVNSFTYKDDISGVYGEVAGTVLVTSGDGTLSGFLTANGEFGDDYTKYGAKVGVRKGF